MQPHPRFAREVSQIQPAGRPAAGWWTGRAATNRSAKREVAVVPRTGAVWRTIAQSKEWFMSPAVASAVSISSVRTALVHVR